MAMKIVILFRCAIINSTHRERPEGFLEESGSAVQTLRDDVHLN
jgi:hypothetical protein